MMTDNKIKLLFFILLYSVFLFGQMTVPFTALPLKANLRICAANSIKCTLYATVYTDTLKKYRIWLFCDTSKILQETESILLEQFDTYNVLKKQFFLSKNHSTFKENWEYIDFLKNDIYSENRCLIKHIQKELLNHWVAFAPQWMPLFKEELVATIRYSNIQYNGLLKKGLWKSAVLKSVLQVNYSVNNNEIKDWMTFTPYPKTINDTLEIKQEWKWGYEYFTLTRVIDKKKLLTMTLQETMKIRFRDFQYDDTEKLYRIEEGYNNIDKKIESIIYIDKN